MILVLAVEEGGGEGVELEPDGSCGHGFQPGRIAVQTTLGRVGGDSGEEFFQAVFIVVDDLQLDHCGILADRPQPFQVFLVGVDIVIEEKTGDLQTAGPHFLHRIDGARGAAHVEEYFHCAIIYRGSVPCNTLVIP
jgi:hypothetical protein